MTTVSLLILSLAAADVNAPSSRGVLLDFSATWCGPCQQMNPIVSRLKRQGYPVRKVDVDQERSLAQQYNIRSMPTFVLVVDGKERTRVVGMTSEGQLRRLLSQIPHDPQPSIIANPSPPSVAPRTPQAPIQVADNSPAQLEKKSVTDFLFPFGANTKANEPPATNPDVIRAKLDQDNTLATVSIEDNPLASSVRVRITTENGVNYGSGTIIQSLPGRTVILTCGHIFRDLKDDAKIEVDFFNGTKPEIFVGKTIGYDLEGDVGLLSIATDAKLPESPLSAADGEVRVRQGVYSIGCGGGEPPSREDLYVTALNRYLGPDNIECTGEPLQGRSGGGLFNVDGDVVGVCVAADPRDKRGLYAGLKVIHQLLKDYDLSNLVPAMTLPAAPMLAKGGSTSAAEKSPDVAPPLKTAVAKGGEIGLPAGLATSGEAEVICIVRPLNQPKSASEVVIINRASSRFVSYLTQELKDKPVPTTLHQAHASQELEAPPFALATACEAPPFSDLAAPPVSTMDQSAATQGIQRYRRRRIR